MDDMLMTFYCMAVVLFTVGILWEKTISIPTYYGGPCASGTVHMYFSNAYKFRSILDGGSSIYPSTVFNFEFVSKTDRFIYDALQMKPDSVTMVPYKTVAGDFLVYTVNSRALLGDVEASARSAARKLGEPLPFMIIAFNAPDVGEEEFIDKEDVTFLGETLLTL
ncbi:hypothetical protein BKA67DRAFT_660040 [Truncatella angustata]|uniref:Uncharacterized protein n=1 Tax=Truncatella angustata TaxID=152316 RepID=A0A9P8UJU4_9PEZI|nr:uncharacterized protein BKA67DRAFT_660040 [Truncatella angustata]KAH6653414.1 hypothetical protein BKA67DRAFT_660040 [Truncatella angustata]